MHFICLFLFRIYHMIYLFEWHCPHPTKFITNSAVVAWQVEVATKMMFGQQRDDSTLTKASRRETWCPGNKGGWVAPTADAGAGSRTLLLLQTQYPDHSLSSPHLSVRPLPRLACCIQQVLIMQAPLLHPGVMVFLESVECRAG